ncbi:hypothetical protein [Jiella pelagia]|uniref:Lipoprotein n=1 Tax=Jiella pelagia TaxID=2986949 RepID=A0ABY7C7A4_9HYPH|nr:hypothetical protein [Jiella pelagia]WAP71447.1 hypothetical protein OH818_28630 [Jiella pelagia]
MKTGITNLIRIALLGVAVAFAAGCASTGSSTDTPPVSTVSTGALETDRAAANPIPTADTPSGEAVQELYYLEFRARSAESYGHTFAMFGRRNAKGDILTREVAGLHPASTSDVPYVLGHIIPVPSETGPSDGDLEDQYMTARYRLDLSKAEYDDVVDYIRELQARLAGLARSALQLQCLRGGHRPIYGPAHTKFAPLPGGLHQHAAGIEHIGTAAADADRYREPPLNSA